MARRLIDTMIWSKPWFTELTPAEKLAWFYVSHNCDNIGLWSPNYRLAEFIIGQQLDWSKFAEKCNGNIEIQPTGKWWIVDYCKFQHRDLSPDSDGSTSNRAVLSYIRDLKEHGLWDKYCNYYHSFEAPNRPQVGPEDAPPCGARLGKGKGKGKGKGEEEERVSIGNHFSVSADQWSNFTADFYEHELRSLVEQMNDWIDSKKGGKSPYKDYAAALRNWIKKAKMEPRLKETETPLERLKREAAE